MLRRHSLANITFAEQASILHMMVAYEYDYLQTLYGIQHFLYKRYPKSPLLPSTFVTFCDATYYTAIKRLKKGVGDRGNTEKPDGPVPTAYPAPDNINTSPASVIEGELSEEAARTLSGGQSQSKGQSQSRGQSSGRGQSAQTNGIPNGLRRINTGKTYRA